MQVLTINCGTRSLRFDVHESKHVYGEPLRLVHGVIRGIGSDASSYLEVGRTTREEPVIAGDHAEAFRSAMALLKNSEHFDGIEAVCHRVVHGGQHLQESRLIDDETLAMIEAAQEFAPLHNAAALGAIRVAQAQFLDKPMVAVFDTAFFVDLPEATARYALPGSISDQLGIRRSGGQGFAHRYMVERFRSRRPHDEESRLVTLQLGTDCSVTASRNGQPLDTSMGFSLAEGLISSTRSGVLDPALPLFLMNQGNLSSEQVWRLLNTESGLMGLSGISGDFQELAQESIDGNVDAALAIEAFCIRAKEYVGAYVALLGGADAIIFGGGIGEHSPDVRARICEGFEWAGVRLDPRFNQPARGETRISDDDSTIEVWVMRVDEAAVMVSELMNLVV